jgi:transcriptional regulator with XRE-family HTH domain
MSESIGARIRKARVKYGMSQAELARRIDVSLNAMNKIELGNTPDPRASRIRAIADVLRVSTDYLLGRKDEDSEPFPTETALVGPRPSQWV